YPGPGVPTVAPGPTSREATNPKVGPLHLVTRATLGIIAAGVNGIFTTSAAPEKSGLASASCAHVSSASASLSARATVQIPFFHTFTCYPRLMIGGPRP